MFETLNELIQKAVNEQDLELTDIIENLFFHVEESLVKRLYEEWKNNEWAVENICDFNYIRTDEEES